MILLLGEKKSFMMLMPYFRLTKKVVTKEEDHWRI